MKKLPFAGLVLLGTSALTFCVWRFSSQPAAEASQITAPVAANSVKNVLPKITARGVKLDDTAEMLEMKMWKFDVQLPKTQHSFQFMLQLREKGKSPQILFTEGWYKGLPVPINGRLSVFIGAYPLTGMTRGTEKVKYVIRIDGYAAQKGQTVGGWSSTDMVANPFKGLTDIGSASIPLQSKDGSFVLMKGNRKPAVGAPTTPADVELVFVTQDLH